MSAPQTILRVALPTPLRRLFDYLPPEGVEATRLRPGVRLRLPFGRGRAIGVLVAVASESEVPAARLRRAEAVLDLEPILPEPLLALVLWAAEYYHHSLGDALGAALPVLLRKGEAAEARGPRRWSLTATGAAVDPATLRRAPRQRQLLERLREAPLEEAELEGVEGDTRGVLRRLEEKGWLTAQERPCLEAAPTEGERPPPLNRHQGEAVEAVAAALGRFEALLLEGVTGSGKTEVYLNLIARALERGEQVLVLVPEIGLTPQLARRFRRRFPVPIALLHSGLNDRERLCAWLAARDGRAPIVIGTRSALFTPLPRLGLIIVDEEHDPSLKQQEGFRYSARDLALVRAQRAGVPVLLGSATPSLESLFNVRQGRYRHLLLPERAGGARHPRITVLDVRQRPMDEGLSDRLLERIATHLGAGGQVLVFLNRRGFAPLLTCHACGWVAECRRCDARLTLHRHQGRLVCHHCGSERPLPVVCPECGGEELRPVGRGTERVEQALTARFPAAGVARIDRDTTQRKGSLERLLEEARAGAHRILLGTQMLAKGHHFPDVTLAAILDADYGLFANDFRAPERMAQLLIQVAGRAGRTGSDSEVVIQSRHPDHPLLHTLVTRGYPAFAEAALAERRAAALPPYAHQALLRAEASSQPAAFALLEAVAARARETAGDAVEVWGPVPAPMERRAGRFRAQLLLQAGQRAELHRLLALLTPELERLPEARKARWSLDVDPQELY